MSLSIQYIFSQVLVIVYYIIYSSTFHLKDNKKVLILGIIATLVSFLSYFLLGAYTGMAMCFVAIFRNVLFYKYKKNSVNLYIVFALIIIALTFTYKGFFCIFNIIATIIYTYALWQDDTKKYKLLGIIVNGLMIVYNIYIQSIMGTILIFVAFISSIIGYIRTFSNKGENK